MSAAGQLVGLASNCAKDTTRAKPSSHGRQRRESIDIHCLALCGWCIVFKTARQTSLQQNLISAFLLNFVANPKRPYELERVRRPSIHILFSKPAAKQTSQLANQPAAKQSSQPANQPASQPANQRQPTNNPASQPNSHRKRDNSTFHQM